MSCLTVPNRAACGIVVMALSMTVSSAFAADHRDAPLLRPDRTGPPDVGSRDLNDVYIFQSPARSQNVVLVATTNPFAGILSPLTLDPKAQYELAVDNNGDAVEDVIFRFTFSAPDRRGVQRYVVEQFGPVRIRGRGRAAPPPTNGRPTVLAEGNTGRNFSPVRGGRGQVRVALHDDPFFFDANGFNRGDFSFTGDDFFAGANVIAMILDIPHEMLGADNVGVWGRTILNGAQIDRNGRPAINTALIPPVPFEPPGAPNRKDAFNAGQPVNDQRDFRADVEARLRSLGNDQTRASFLAGILLPDILTVNTASSAGFLNGRRLEDDVIDAELNLLSNGAVTTDMVDSNDKTFLTRFPYLASPH